MNEFIINVSHSTSVRGYAYEYKRTMSVACERPSFFRAIFGRRLVVSLHRANGTGRLSSQPGSPRHASRARD